MAVFKATQNKSDSAGKFKATKNRSYDSTLVYDWETRNKESYDALEKYRQRINSGGYLSADDLTAYRKALDSYVETATSLRGFSKAMGQGKDDDDAWTKTIADMESGYKGISDYFSQWKTEDDYIFSSSDKSAEDRQKRYEGNQKRVEEIKNALPWYGDTILPSFVENIFLNDEQEALKKEMEYLEAANLRYERGAGGYGSKTVDDYYNVTQNSDFGAVSANRDHGNPTRDELSMHDAFNDSSTWYYDENDILRDAYGNEIVKDSSGRLVNPNAQKYAVTDRLGIFLSATEKDVEEYMGTIVSGTWGSVIGDGIDGSWKYLDENEINIYYYLLNTDGQEAADKYLSDMKTELNRRETDEMQAHIDEAPFLEQIFLNAVSIPMSVFGGVTALAEDAANVIRGNDINPYSGAHSFQNTANYTRSKTASDINNLTGNAALPFVGTTFGDVYQSMMSFGDSALASFVPSGHVLLGLNAASSEMKDLYERGGSTEQILSGGILAGVAEMFFEKYSIGELNKLKNMDAKAVKNFTDGFVRAAIMGGVEASEEMATEIANTISDALVMGSQTDWVDMGTFVKNVVNAGIGGFISGGFGGAIAAKMNNAQYNQQVAQHGQSIIDKGGVDALQQLALEMSGSNKAIGKLSNQVSSEATAKNVGKLSDMVGETVTAQNRSDIIKALEEKGLSKKDAKRVAEYLNKAAQGEYFTEQEAAEAMGNKKIAEVLRDVVADPKSSVNARTINLINARLGKAAQTQQAQQGVEIASTEGNLTTQEESVPESHYEVSEDGQMVDTKTGNTINPQGLVKAADGTYKIAVKDTEPVSTSDVSYADNNQALVYETFVNLEGNYGKTNKVIASMDLDSRNALLGMYSPEINKDGGAFAKAAVSAYFYGHQGIPFEAIAKDPLMSELTDQQRKIAWNQGRMVGMKATTDVQSHVDTVYAEAKKALEQTGAKKGAYHAVLDDGISPMQLNEKQRAVYSLADEIAQGVQTNIRVYDGTNKAQGFYNHATDEIWLNLNAAKTSREHIMAFTLAHELVHRAKKGSPAKYKAFTEFLLNEYGKQGSDIEAMIREQMDAAERFNKTVPKSKQVNMTREKALEEVVCDACSRMLLDTNAGQKLAEFGAQSRQNKSFLEDLKRWISELLDKLRNYFRGVDPDSKAGREFAKFDESVKQILADMYVDMSIDAGEKLSTIKAAYGGAFAEKFLGTKDIQYNLAAVETHKDKLQKEYSEDSSTDLETIMNRYNKIIDIWTRLGGELKSNFLAEWNSKIGKDRTFTIFKAQAGYKYNVELSSMCKKGVPLFEAIDTIVKQEVMKELNLAVLGKAEKEILYDILKQHHFEIPCAICYVEQARQREGVIIDAFLNGKVEKNAKGETTKEKLGWNQVLDSIQKEMKANGVDYSFAQVSRDIATEKYSPADLSMDAKTQDAFYAALKKIANQEISRYNKAEGKSRKLLAEVTPEAVKECFKGTLPANLKIFKVLFEEPSSRFKITSDLLYSSVATQNLSMAHNKLYGLFNSQGGVSGYKTKQGTTIYWGDILGKSWKPDILRNEGGVRNQSNSDFQMYTLLDQAQMYIDFTAKGYYLQAYTKVLSELKLFGLSRGKINASLIPRVVVYLNADGTDVDVERTMATAGLDENGNPIYDDIEGINHNEAFMLIEDPEYSKSICGICIGYSDAHILKLLDDIRVQQIIGFHDKTDDGTKRYKGARYAKNYNGLNEAVNKDGKTVHIGFNPYVKKAEKKFKFNAETETFEGTVNYNGKTYTADDIPKLAADLYLEMCAKKGYTPAYDDFKGHPNYYKLLADFGLYDSLGHYAPHRKVVYNMPDTVPYLDANGKKQTMKTYDYIKVELKKELAVRDSIAEALADTSSEGIIPQFKAAVKKSHAEDSQDEKSFSLPKGEPAPTFYSLMARVVDGLKQEKFGASTVVSTLRNKGVKVEEIKWSGIEAWLDGKKSVTKAELQEFIAGSMLQIEEEILDNKDRPYTEDQQKRLDEYEAKRAEIAKRLADEWKKITGEEFPVRNPGAGLESTVVNKIIDANKEHKDAGRRVGDIEKPTDNKYIKMVEEGATHIGEYDVVPKSEEPKKTILAWKALVVKPGAKNNPKDKSYGNMYPPQVHQVASTPYGVWLYANEAPKKLDKDGNPELTKYGRPKVKEGMTYRPAWHFGDVPYASQFKTAHGFFDDNGVRRFYMAESKGILVWALCEMAADENYQDEADMAGHVGENRIWDEQQASLWYLPENGYYKYMTNRVDPNSVTWYLSDKMRIVQTITDAEMRDILNWVKEDGATDLEFNYPLRLDGKDVDPADYGIPVGNVVGDGIDYVDRWKNQFREIAMNGDIDITQSHFYYVPSSATNYGSYETVSFSKEVDDHSQELLKTKKDAQILTVNPTSKSAATQSFEELSGISVKEANTMAGRTKIIEAAKRLGYDIVEFTKGGKNLGTDVVIVNPDSVIRNYKFNNVSERHGRADAVSYKLPIGEDTSPRALLANAFEGIITNDIEKRRLQEYKGKVDMLNAEEQKLHALRAQIKKLSFAKGKRDNKKIKELQFDAIQTANRIATLDKVLLGMEAAAPLQNILKREKEMAYKRAEQKGKEALEAYKKAERERDAKWQSEVKEKYQASKKKAIETREKREAREKLQKLVLDTAKWISYPSKTDVKCPDILKQPYANFLNGIDLSSKRLADGGDPTKTDLRLASSMESLATALDKIMTSQDPTQETDKVLDTGYLDLPADFVRKLRDMTESIKAMMVDGDFVVNNMSAEEVRKLSQMIRTLNHAIKTMSKLYANLRFANVEALGFDTMEFMDALGEIEKTGGVKDFVEWKNALPYYAFKRFGKGGESIFEGLMDAQDKLAYLSQIIFNFQEKTWSGDEAKAWSEDTHTIDLPNGNKLTLTTADAMSIYCLSRREQGLQHLLGGGTRVMGIQKGSQKAKDSRSLLTIKDIDAIISSLTDRQKQVAEAMQAFMSDTCSEWGNEISMKRFLTKEFNERFYFPIESNDENLPTKDPAAQQSDLFRLLNISATKPLTPGANNEVIIRNIFDVFSGHAADMARLNAFGMALLDYMKWLNYREKTVNEEGQIKVKGVRKSMENAFGDAAKSYVMNLVKDVNGRPSDNGLPGFYTRLVRNTKTAMVGNSLRVATLQITSYPRAALVLSPKSLALGLSKMPNIEKAKKYCGIALWKSYGFYDTNISRSIEDQMKGVKDVRQKLIELSLKGAEIGDAITWGALWNACEYDVAQTTKNKVGSEEFYQEVGNKLREVVYRTQVVDSVLTRSEMMRSKNAKAQELSAFMSEPTLSANILMDAGMEFSMEKRRTGSAKAAWQKTGKYVTRAVAVYAIGQLAAALMEGLWDAWRDDEDEEFTEKFANAFAENLVLDLLPFNKIPILSEMAEGAMSLMGIGYFSSDSLSSTALSQTVSAVKAWSSVLGGNSSATVYNALYKSMRAVSSFYGVSFSGVMREGVALWNNTAGAYDPTLKIITYERSKTDLGNLLYDAIISGDDNQAESIRSEFRDRAKDEKEYQSSINSAIRKALRENDPRILKAAQAVMNGNGIERANIAREIAAEGHFDLQDIQAAINAEIDKLRKEAKGN